MTTIDFLAMRNMLQMIGEAVGEKYVVSCTWNGHIMTFCVSDPKKDKTAMCMKFDNEGDYIMETSDMITQIIKETKKWYGSKK